MVIDESLGSVLREARMRKGLTLRAAAEGTGMSYSSLHRIETGERDRASLDALLRLGTKLGISQAAITRLAGGLEPEGLKELAGGHVRGALRSGRLGPEAMTALRRIHVAGLIAPFAAHLADVPVDVRELASAVDLIFAEVDSGPDFDDDGGRFFVPAQRNPIERIIQRAWMAHGVAHALLADDAGERRTCTSRAPRLEREREATYLAMRIVVPSARLSATLRARPLGQMIVGEELVAALEEIASDFDVPATFAATRLAEESALAVMP